MSISQVAIYLKNLYNIKEIDHEKKYLWCLFKRGSGCCELLKHQGESYFLEWCKHQRQSTLQIIKGIVIICLTMNKDGTAHSRSFYKEWLFIFWGGEKDETINKSPS